MAFPKTLFFGSRLSWVTLALTSWMGSAAPLLAAEPPKLVVVLVVDQFRGDFIARYREHFVPGGIQLMLAEGAYFSECHYRQSITKTAAGHAVILSGVHADVHGIIANDWLDRATLKKVNSIDDDTVQLIGVSAARGGAKLPAANAAAGGSPRNFLATTVSDDFKLAHAGRPKIITISSKDRSAILLGGKQADAAYWMDQGRMISSTYYQKQLPEWVQAFNDVGRVESFFGKTWERLLPLAAYEKIHGPDDVPWEYAGLGLGRTLPKRIDGGAATIGAPFYNAFELSPFKSEVLVDFARAVLENENLGRRGVTDFLGVSFSVNDSIGHEYGPDSHEVMDMMLRTDRMLADLFKVIDERVGLKNCTILLTGDHGAPPMPERLRTIAPGMDAGRIDHPRALNTGEAALTQAFGALPEGRRWFVTDSTALIFSIDVLKERNVAPAAAEAVLRDALLTIPFIAAAFTRTELAAHRATGEFAAAAQLSFHPLRSGDVLYIPKPYWLDRKTGTNHGTPYNYDTHVPLLWLGVGVIPSLRSERIGVDDIAPTLANILGRLAPPRGLGRNLF